MTVLLNPYRFATPTANTVVGQGLTSGLVSYWNMGALSGSTVVDSHGSNDLSASGVTAETRGAFDCLSVTPSGGVMTISDAAQTGLDFTGDFSASFWVQWDVVDSSLRGLFYKATGDLAYLLRLEAGRIADLLSQDGSSFNKNNLSFIPSTGIWYHFVYVHDTSGPSVRFYVNTTLEGSGTGEASINDSGAAFSVGNSSSGTNRPFDGAFARFGMWSRVLTVGEISTLYNGGAGLPYS